MAEELVMPRLSDTMAEGTIGKWHKQVGDRITKGDVILELQTDKANMELEAFSDGYLDRILLPEGGTADVGTPIGIIRGLDEASAGDGATRSPAAAAPGTSTGTAAGATAGAQGTEAARPRRDRSIPGGPREAVVTTAGDRRSGAEENPMQLPRPARRIARSIASERMPC